MPIPTNITDLSETASSNSPGGSEPLGTQANEYLQAAFAFIKQLADGNGILPSGPLNMNAQQILNLLDGVVSSTSAYAVNARQLISYCYKVGEVRMWSGAAANIAAIWGAGWQLADGSNGTPNLVNRFVVGGSGTYPVGTTGGGTQNILSSANMPAHTHGINDPGHSHTVNDPGHSHAVNDPGHSHVISSQNVTGGGALSSNGASGTVFSSTNSSATGISVASAGSNVSANSASTGVTTQSAGSGTPFSIVPPYYALCFVCYTGIGV